MSLLKRFISVVLSILFSLFIVYWIIGKDSPSTEQKSIAAPSIEKPLSQHRSKKLVYLVSDTRIPFWAIMARGIESKAKTLGYQVSIYNAQNDPKKELEFTVRAIRDNVGGIIVSPTTSSACSTILKLSKNADIPVVIADIGTDHGDYVSYIASDNKDGAYQIGRALVGSLQRRGWENGTVGIIAIPQKRLNGQARTSGFMKALDEAGIKGAGIKQQETFSYEETFRYTKELIQEHPDLRALWLQGSDRYQAALDAIAETGKKREILLLTFDAEPEFLELIPKRILIGSAMQQPFLMGQKAVETMDRHLNGQRVEKNILLPVLAVSARNIDRLRPTIRHTVLGIESK